MNTTNNIVVRRLVATSPMTTWHMYFIWDKIMGGRVLTYLGDMTTNDNVVVHRLVATSPTTWHLNFVCHVYCGCARQCHVHHYR